MRVNLLFVYFNFNFNQPPRMLSIKDSWLFYLRSPLGLSTWERLNSGSLSLSACCICLICCSVPRYVARQMNLVTSLVSAAGSHCFILTSFRRPLHRKMWSHSHTLYERDVLYGIDVIRQVCHKRFPTSYSSENTEDCEVARGWSASLPSRT